LRGGYLRKHIRIDQIQDSEIRIVQAALVIRQIPCFAASTTAESVAVEQFRFWLRGTAKKLFVKTKS
jgi:hypothetical protein